MNWRTLDLNSGRCKDSGLTPFRTDPFLCAHEAFSIRFSSRYGRFAFYLLLVPSFSLQMALGQMVHQNASFHVAGRIEYRFFDLGKTLRDVTNRFRVTVEGSRSEIIATDIPSTGDMQVESYDYKTDGTNSCTITLFAHNRKRDDGRHRNKTQLTAFADLRSDVFPPSHTGCIGPVWLAFGSGGTLEGGVAGEIPALVFMGPGWPQYGRRLGASWVKAVTFPSLPERLVEYADPQVFSFTDNLARQYQGKSIPAVYQEGYTNAFYQVILWTNVGNLRLPLHSRFTKYVPKADGRSNTQLDVELTYDCYTERVIKLIDHPVVMPKVLPQDTRVSDYRFSVKDDEPYIYVTSSGKMLTLNQIKRRQSPTRTKRILVVCAMAVPLLALPVALFLLNKRRKSRNDNITMRKENPQA